MNKLLRRIRLLPLVILVGFSLLTVKGFGLLREAEAAATGDEPGMEQTSPADPNDPAADDTGLGSAAEVDVLTSLTKRRKELDAREQQIAMRENVIAAAEQRVENRITQLQALQVEVQKLLGQRDAEEQKQIDSLVKTYSAMKPKDAARIFNTLDEEVLLAVAQKMKSDVLAPVLAGMESEKAQKLTIALASRLKVQTPPVLPAPAPVAPAPDGAQPTASNPSSPAPAPAQLAANTTPPAAPAPQSLPTPQPTAAPSAPAAANKTADAQTPPKPADATPAKPVKTAAHRKSKTKPTQAAATAPMQTATNAPANPLNAAYKPPVTQPAAITQAASTKPPPTTTAPAQAPAVAPGTATAAPASLQRPAQPAAPQAAPAAAAPKPGG